MRMSSAVDETREREATASVERDIRSTPIRAMLRSGQEPIRIKRDLNYAPELNKVGV